MKFLMKIESIGRMLSPDVFGTDMYLEWFRPDNRHKDMPMISLTDQIDKAQKFDTMAEAMELWRTSIGTRADGKPDRPLTAYSITFATLTTEASNEQE
jgi:hypothetical protein